MLSSDFHLDGTAGKKKKSCEKLLLNTFLQLYFTLITHFIFLFEVIDDMAEFLELTVLEDKKNSKWNPFLLKNDSLLTLYKRHNCRLS